MVRKDPENQSSIPLYASDGSLGNDSSFGFDMDVAEQGPEARDRNARNLGEIGENKSKKEMRDAFNVSNQDEAEISFDRYDYDYNYAALLAAYRKQREVDIARAMEKKRRAIRRTKQDWLDYEMRGSQKESPAALFLRKHRTELYKEGERRTATKISDMMRSLDIAQSSSVALLKRGFTKEEEDKIAAAVAIDAYGGEVLVTKYNIPITRTNMQCLLPGTWLNDEVINFHYAKIAEEVPGCHSMKTFFVLKLLGANMDRYNYVGVKRWTRRIDIFSKDKIFIPVNLPGHWALAVVNLKRQRMEYYDSLNYSKGLAILSYLAKYLEDEWQDKKGRATCPYSFREWPIISRENMDIPHQKNGDDCGVFCCIFGEYVAKELQFDFKHTDMPMFRRYLIFRILAS